MNTVKKPLVSIIVPVYNVEKYLNKCMDSLINQTFDNIEIIAVNDGSTDSSLEIIKKYTKNDNRVRIINQLNQGLSGARNSGISKANGEFIMFVDGDDWINKETCEVAYKTCLDNNPDVVMWSYVREYEKLSLPKVIFKEDKIFNEEQCRMLHRRFAGLMDDELSDPENSDNLATAWGKLYRTHIITKNNLTFHDLKEIGTYEDGLFNLHYFYYVKKAVFINKYLNHYLKSNSNALTKTYKSQLFKHYKNLFQIINAYICNNNLPNDFNTALNNKICLSIIGLGLTECLKSNPKSTYERIRFIRNVINDPVYKNAFKQLDLKYFPLHWKIFFGCSKYNVSVGVYLLLLAIQKIISR